MSERRLAWIDSLRVVDAALVVLVHTDYLARPDPFTWWPAGISSIVGYGLCVPVFFALAGYVAARSTSRELVLRAVRLIPLLFAHGIVLLLLDVRHEPTLVGQLGVLAMGVWYLYFVAALVQIQLAHALLSRFGRAVLFFAAAATALSYAASSARLWGVGSDFGALELRLRSLGTTWAGFYALGVVLARRPAWFEAAVRRAALVTALAVALAIPFLGEVIAEDHRYGHASTMQTLVCGLPFQVVGTLAVMALFARAALRWERLIEKLAAAAPATISVYLLHGTFLWLLYRAWIRAGAIVHPLEVPVLATLAVLCSLTVRWIARRLPQPLPWVLAGVAK